ncbi:hypothetical protein RF11_03327 [Thelohanellus kitauei]|uniref:EGF-like domain-containing protein n=1 Tax=Thelohanellus kitauei TaxID=669202 RepID=A0A0C2MS02_THEKT|nr:hypothetical protein RF11_03327 [Thelohanellus kitauei]
MIENYTGQTFCVCKKGYGGERCDKTHHGAEEELIFMKSEYPLDVKKSKCDHCSGDCYKYYGYEYCASALKNISLYSCENDCQIVCGQEICKIEVDDRIYFYDKQHIPETGDSSDVELEKPLLEAQSSKDD